MEKWKHLKIPLADINSATKSFHKEKIIGRGGFGPVYEGELTFKGKLTKIAAKTLNKGQGQGLKEFLTEIDLLSGQQHENIITLIGYCDEEKHNILVYEHAKHGSLHQYIPCSSATNYKLSWSHRLKIVVEVARGLDHLHNHLHNHQVIIHRDIKSANILLDHNWVAKISDLGMSKSTISGFGRTTAISQACGTVGYVEPEYIEYGFVSRKSDVYSFGMVLFEVLFGRLCGSKVEDGKKLYGELIKKYYNDNNLDVLIDPSLRKQIISEEALIRYSTIAYKCLLDRVDRPTIEDVKKELEEILNSEAQVVEIQRFTLDVINQATVNYAVENSLKDNSRRFGKVYLSNISCREVAMKRLQTKEGILNFEKELVLLSACDHVNIISLVGYCDGRDEGVLVYEYMSNGSLYDYLRKHKSLTIEKGLDICIGVAKGLSYLHSHTNFSIIHGDISSKSILLDHDLVPKISNFESSTAHPLVSQAIANTIQGKDFYLAPEFYETNYKLHQKDDVYALGMVLRDVLLTRIRIFNSNFRSKSTTSPECYGECENLIYGCIEKNPDKRPGIGEVVERLESALKLQKGYSLPTPHTPIRFHSF